MPGIFFSQGASRREFLRTLTVAAGGTVLVHVPQVWGASSSEGTLRVALLSDIHIPANPQNSYRGFYPVRNLAAVVPAVLATKPALTIIDGDVARLEGRRADYEAAKNLLAPVAERMPVYLGLGNHDDRELFHQVFTAPSGTRQDVPGKHVLVVETPVTRFVILDSLMVTDDTPGLLGPLQLRWLAKYLTTAGNKSIVLFVHHTLGHNPGSDLLDVDQLFAVLRSHLQVNAIFYGHSHRYAFSTRQGVQLINIPAVGYNFRDADPVGWVEAVFRADGADLTLHAIGGNRDENGKTRTLQWG